MTTHQMTVKSYTPETITFVCPICGYEVVRDTVDMHRLEVVEEGDQAAGHIGGIGGVNITVEVTEPYD